MKNLKKIISELLAGILVLSLSGCVSVTVPVGGNRAAQVRPFSSTQTARDWPTGDLLPQYRPSGGGDSFQSVLAQAYTESAPQYFTGDGGKGMRLAVLEPAGRGLSADEQNWMPSTIQSSITGDFNRFSAMTIIDRQNLERVLAEQQLSVSGYFSDADYIRIGQLTNTRYILTGSVTRTPTAFMLELSVTDAETGERKASYPPTQVSSLALENLTAVKQATATLLEQLGVRLTSQGRQELARAPDTATVQAEMALARGIAAQRQGTQVAALSYYFRAADLNPFLLEAADRSSVLATNISSGNIGENVRNDIIWRRNWVERLTETEQFFAEFNKTESLPFTLYYSDEIRQGAVNYQNETVILSIQSTLRPNNAWVSSVAGAMQRTLRAVYDGLQATQRTDVWNLGGWPHQRVTNQNSFARQNSNFTVVAELVNDRNRVIGRQTFQAGGWWEYAYDRNAPSGYRVSDNDRSTVNFTVKADDITDGLTIRISTVNGTPAETAARNGVLQVRAMPKANYDNNSVYTVFFGTIRGYAGSGGHITIPSSVWDEPVTSIGEHAFANKQLTNVTIHDSIASIGDSAFASNRLASITIPRSVTTIGNNAFANNQLTGVTIPMSVTAIGYGAFAGNQITSITIGANVRIEDDSFPNNFALFYTHGRPEYHSAYRVAGIYTYLPSVTYHDGTRSVARWTWKLHPETPQSERERYTSEKNRSWTAGIIVIALTGVVCGLVYFLKPKEEESKITPGIGMRFSY